MSHGTRTVSQVIREKTSGGFACCNRNADMMGCSCLSDAGPNRLVEFMEGCVAQGWRGDDLDWLEAMWWKYCFDIL